MHAARGLGSMGNLPSSASLAHRAIAAREGASKMEAIASSAVRAADKVGASLIVVYTQSGGIPGRLLCAQSCCICRLAAVLLKRHVTCKMKPLYVREHQHTQNQLT